MDRGADTAGAALIMAARGVGIGAVIAAPVLVVGGLLAVVLLIFGPSTQANACGPGLVVDVDDVPAGPIAGYSGEQLRNAAYIMNAATSLGLQRDAQIIGVMTAMGESSLQVLDHGDAQRRHNLLVHSAQYGLPRRPRRTTGPRRLA